MTISTKTILEINRLHGLITEATQSSLQYSIEIGTMLLDVKKEVKHGEWEAWLTKHCPDIAVTTAQLYMRLAKPENAAKLEAAAEANAQRVVDLSVRGAAKLLAKPKEPGPPKPPKPPKPTVGKVGKGGSVDLTSLLQNVGADELTTALLDAAWGKEKITELIKILSSRLAPPAKPSPVGAILGEAMKGALQRPTQPTT
jgi:hypothetical protein